MLSRNQIVTSKHPMTHRLSYLPIFFLCFFMNQTAFSQADFVVVNSITIVGNEKTKKHIITRELDFKVGDTLLVSDTSRIIQQTKNKLYNTALFNRTIIYFIMGGATKINVFIEVKERWYIWPSPIFELGDRNFNEWFQDRDAKWDRLQYGLRFRWDNFRGRNEQLKLVTQFGFTRKFELFHTIPYINKNQTLGIKYGASYSTNNQVAFATRNDKLAYFNGTSPNRERFYSQFSFISRPLFYGTHELAAKYKRNWVSDTISELNESYFLNSATQQEFVEVSYEYNINTADVRAYPLKGIVFSTNFSKTFGGVDLETIIGSLAWFKPISTKLFFATKLYGKTINADQIPYFNMFGLGYEQNFVRGYERQVIDAKHFAYSRNSLRWKFLQLKQDINYMMPLEEFNEIPYAFYFTTFIDAGFSSLENTSPANALNNEWLYSAGLGVDIVTYYDLVFRFEYAFTNKKTNGFFLHFEQAF